MILYDQVVIGSSLSALLYAFVNHYPILFTSPEIPFRFDYFKEDVDLSFLDISTPFRHLLTFNECLAVGPPKIALWEALMFALSMDGMCPLSGLCSSIRNVEGTVTCSNEYSKIATFKVNTFHYFGDASATGFGKSPIVIPQNYICYDWVAINKGGKIEQDYMKVGDEFVNHVWFYSSDRIDGNTGVKDACVVSYLQEEQLENFDYSETMARFKLVNEMEKRGLRGPQTGFNSAGNPRHYKIKTTHMFRTKRSKKSQSSTWTPTDNVVVPTLNEEELFAIFCESEPRNNTFMRFYNASCRHHSCS